MYNKYLKKKASKQTKIDISYGSLTCPSKHRHGAILFTFIPRNRPISVAFHDAWGYGGHFSFKPQGPHAGQFG